MSILCSSYFPFVLFHNNLSLRLDPFHYPIIISACAWILPTRFFFSVYLWLCWVWLLHSGFPCGSKRGLPSNCRARAFHGSGFSCCGAWALGTWASVAVVPGLRWPQGCGIFSDQGSNSRLLRWQEDSLPHRVTRDEPHPPPYPLAFKLNFLVIKNEVCLLRTAHSPVYKRSLSSLLTCSLSLSVVSLNIPSLPLLTEITAVWPPVSSVNPNSSGCGHRRSPCASAWRSSSRPRCVWPPSSSLLCSFPWNALLSIRAAEPCWFSSCWLLPPLFLSSGQLWFSVGVLGICPLRPLLLWAALPLSWLHLLPVWP